MVFTRIWSFVKRHRRKVVFAGVVVTGVLWLSRYARRRIKEHQEVETMECLAHIRRQHHFESNQRTCDSTVLSVLPCLREAICQKTNTELLTEQLRSKPGNKLEIWEQLKVMSFTRTLAAVYGCCFLVVYLRVQLNILGGYMYLDSQQSGLDGAAKSLPTAKVSVTSDVQQRYLARVQYIFDQGLDILIKDVHAAVEAVLSRFSLKSQISSLTVCDIINDVRRQIEYRQENGCGDTFLSSLGPYVISENGGFSQAQSMTPDEITIARLNNETKDMIESPDFHTVMTVCLDSGFGRLVEKMGEYFSPNATPETVVADARQPSIATLPLAKVIPIVNGLVHTILSDAPNSFLQDLLLKEHVKDFAANVYEAFCQCSENRCSIG